MNYLNEEKMMVDNSTTQMVSIIPVFLQPYIPIFQILLGGIIGYCVSFYFQHRNNKRQKAKEIITEFRSNFMNLLKSEIQKMENAKYLKIELSSSISINLLLDEKIIENYLDQTGLFRIRNDELVLLYTNDKVFKFYAHEIIKNATLYKQNVKKYSQLIKELQSNQPDSQKFSSGVKELRKRKYGSDLTNEDRFPDFLKVLFLVGITDCRNAFTSGRSWVVEMCKQNTQDLQHIIQHSDPSLEQKAQEFTSSIKNIKESLNNLKILIEDLNAEWQNSQYV